MKKIFITKNEAVAAIVEKVLAEMEDEIVLIVPRGAQLKESASNFHLLKRETEAAHKTVAVESVDEAILAMAEANGIKAIHPLFSDGARALSDILPVGMKASEPRPTEPKHIPPKKAAPPKEEVVFEPSKAMEEKIEEEEREIEEEYGRPYAEAKGPFYTRLMFWVYLAFLALVAWASIWTVDTVWGKANVTINFKKTPWEWNGVVTGSKSATGIDLAANRIPAGLFSDQKNVLVLVPATGKSGATSNKAVGNITVYNYYSASPQKLVATTRFQAPNGKIYRLDKAVQIPGAQMSGGKVTTPGTIDASVTADQSGSSYEADSIDKLTLPGFAGKPQFTTIYGSMKDGVAIPGQNGKPVPTDADIEAGKAKANDMLKQSLMGRIKEVVPEGIKVLDEAVKLNVTKVSVNKSVDASGNFGVFAEGNFQAIGFREDDLDNLLQNMADKDRTKVFKDLSLNFSSITPNFDTGELRFGVEAQGSLVPAFDPVTFKLGILGKSISEAKNTVLGVPELSDGNISVWPVWLGSIPERANRVNVTAE